MKRVLHTLLLPTCLFVAVPIAPVVAQDPVSDVSQESGLAAAEDARFAAMVRHDVPVIAASLSDDLMFGHVPGMRVDKNRFMADITGGKLPYKSIIPRDRVVKVYGQVGVTRGVVDMVVGDRHLSDGYLAVYLRHGSGWQLLDWQSAAPPPKPGDLPHMPEMPPVGQSPK